MEIERTALVTHSARDMYRLVLDVPTYPHFLSWCSASTVLEQSDRRQVASLQVAMAGIERTFTTRNELVPGQQISMGLVDGPFRNLSGDWMFTQLGTDGCKISLSLAFEFSSPVLTGAFARGFVRIADRLVADFCARADHVYA
jgi:ribosome-associated toxin RatA of RatAB toxin-antitoxin module